MLTLSLLILFFFFFLFFFFQSTGNFITLSDAIAEYSADATRFALADAGDGLEDANFERKSANAAILKLTKEEVWVKELVDWDAKNPATPLRTGPLNFFDRVLLNELKACALQADAAYGKLQFRESLKYSFHQLTIERDNYKLALDAEKNPERMHRDVLWTYFETLAVTLSPLCPHFCQHLWQITGLDQKNKAPSCRSPSGSCTRCQKPAASVPRTVAAIALYAAVNAATIGIFIHRPFTWVDGTTARLMW